MSRKFQVRAQGSKCCIILAIALFFFAVLFAGCISVSLVKGEYFLSAEQYVKGESVFRKEISKKPEEADNWYYLGRFLLAQEKYRDAGKLLKKAIALDPYRDKYHFWLGVCYGGLKQTGSEIQAYKKAVELNPKYYQAYTYLGHSYFRSKKYKSALQNYDKALSCSDYNPSALYNKALIHYRLKQYTAAKTAFKGYVKKYKYSPRSVRAAAYLNRMGDFDYRVHLLNKRKRRLEKIQFAPNYKTLSDQSKRDLKIAGKMVEKDETLELHVLAYEKKNLALARKKAVYIKNYLEDFFPRLKPGQVKISFFGVPEKIRYGKKTYTLNSSINLFVTPGVLTK